MLPLILIACEPSPPEKDGAVDTGSAYWVDTSGGVDETGDSGPVDTGDSSQVDSGDGDTAGTGDSGDTADSGDTGETLLADAVADFSDVQGENGWYYGYIEPDGANTFVEMPTYNYGGPDPGWYAASGGAYWTFIDAETMHPNGETTTGGRTPVEQWAVRRWVSTVSGDVRIRGHLAKLSVDGDSSGVGGYIHVDGVTRWAWYIEGWDDGGTDVDKVVTVAVGSTVDFLLDPWESDDRSDRSYFYATISQ